jgi:hypothetical protein
MIKFSKRSNNVPSTIDEMGMDESISVAEMFHDDMSQGFAVSFQGSESPTTQRCFVVVKDGQASIVDESDAPQPIQP